MPARHLIPISGKDSAATAVVQIARNPDLDYEFFFNPTGSELPESDAWLSKMEAYLGKPILRIGENLEDIIHEEGILPNHSRRFCTRLSKIFPMENYIGRDPAYVYYGIRADEQRVGYQSMSKTNIVPVYPLKELGLGIRQVWGILDERGLLPPAFFWESVYEMVCSEIGRPLVEELLEPWERALLFAWRSRNNCFHCFYQRRYEWIGLLEHHPELFWKSVEMEETIGGKDFHWIKGLPLRKLAENKERYKEKRAKEISKIVLYKKEHGTFDTGEINLLDTTSCGLFCGK